jgi:hypothetical protein
MAIDLVLEFLHRVPLFAGLTPEQIAEIGRGAQRRAFRKGEVIAQGWVDCLKLERATLLDQMRADPDIADRIADTIRGRLTLVAAELQIIDGLLMRFIEHSPDAHLGLLPLQMGNAPASASLTQ